MYEFTLYEIRGATTLQRIPTYEVFPTPYLRLHERLPPKGALAVKFFPFARFPLDLLPLHTLVPPSTRPEYNPLSLAFNRL